VPGEIRGTLIGAQFGLEHVLVAHALGEAGGGRLDIDAVQHLVEQQAIDAAPHPAQPHRRGLPELGDGEDAGAVQALLHAFADAVDLLQFEAEQDAGQIVMRDDDETVRLLLIGADFAEKDVGREADRAGEALADLLAQRPLDFQRSVPISRQAISSIDMTFSLGRQVSTAFKMRS
jgi:hypothetical protein